MSFQRILNFQKNNKLKIIENYLHHKSALDCFHTAYNFSIVKKSCCVVIVATLTIQQLCKLNINNLAIKQTIAPPTDNLFQVE